MQAPSAAIKRYLPKSLFWRAVLILVIPILLLQGVVASVFVRRHYDSLTEQMAGAIAREIGFAVRTVEEAEDADLARKRLDRISRTLHLDMRLEPVAPISPGMRRAVYDLTGRVIGETFDRLIAHPTRLDLLSVRKHAYVQVLTERGILTAVVPRTRMNASNPHHVLVWMTGAAVALTGVAVVFLRNQVRPIRELARAAAAFGRGRAVPFRPRGAEEVRRAGQAFLDMRRRIERQIGQRTAMLCGVSHDLRTPLTRMKLALAVAPPCAETEELARDVAEMEQMIEAFLDFARGEGVEPPEPVDVAALAEEVAADARRNGLELTLSVNSEAGDGDDAGIGGRVSMRRHAIKRCLANLLDNAARYGQRVAMAVRLTPRVLEFAIEDDGPGIPAERREEAMRPFTRLDASRNQDEGPGVGLGLSITLDIARSHGGTLTLEDSGALGGLKASLLLPR